MLLFIFLETGFGSLVSYLGFKADCFDLIGFGGEIYPPQPILRVNHPDSSLCTSLHRRFIVFRAVLELPLRFIAGRIHSLIMAAISLMDKSILIKYQGGRSCLSYSMGSCGERDHSIWIPFFLAGHCTQATYSI